MSVILSYLIYKYFSNINAFTFKNIEIGIRRIGKILCQRMMNLKTDHFRCFKSNPKTGHIGYFFTEVGQFKCFRSGLIIGSPRTVHFGNRTFQDGMFLCFKDTIMLKSVWSIFAFYPEVTKETHNEFLTLMLHSFLALISISITRCHSIKCRMLFTKWTASFFSLVFSTFSLCVKITFC